MEKSHSPRDELELRLQYSIKSCKIIRNEQAITWERVGRSELEPRF
jgi:hypothetical protein